MSEILYLLLLLNNFKGAQRAHSLSVEHLRTRLSIFDFAPTPRPRAAERGEWAAQAVFCRRRHQPRRHLAKLWRAILQSASQLASLLDSRLDMPFARLFPFGVIKQQGSGASFSEISSHALLG
jgi:hypothetical protein